MPTVLVTGFQPFLEHRVNPSATLARRIQGLRLGAVRFASVPALPVEYGRAARVALDAARARRADVILALGLARGETVVRLESRGRNRSYAKDADNAGQRGLDRPVRAGAPATLSTRLPLTPVERCLRARGIPVRRSDDAGGYVCNDLYYRLLWAARVEGAPPVLFVHVPPDVDPDRVAAPLATGVARALLRTARSRR